MRRRITRIRVTPRRKARPKPEHEMITTALTTDQIELQAQLHEQAAHHVTATLSRMQERTQQAARTTPELAPFLTAYFEAAGHSLLHNTLALLDEPPLVSPRPPQDHRQNHRSFPLFCVIPFRRQKESSDGAA